MEKKVITLFLLIGILVILSFALTTCSLRQNETNTYELNEKFSSISVKTDTADIVLLPSDDEKCKVVCYEEKNLKHSVSIADGALVVNVIDTRKWYEHLNITVKTSKITIYLPESKYSSLIIEEDTGDIEIPNDFKFESIDVSLSTGDVECCASTTGAIKIASSTGNISVKDISAGMLELSASTGDVTASGVRCEGDVKINVTTGKTDLCDITCQNIISSGDTGDISLNNVVASDRISIERSTGDVEFYKSDAKEIYIATSTGDVNGSLLTEKVFIIKTNTGRFDVPPSISGGRCEISTTTGNIEVKISSD